MPIRKKKIIEKQVDYFNIENELLGDFKDIILTLQNSYEEAVKEGYSELRLVEGEYIYGEYDDSGYSSLALKGKRLETDQEFEERKEATRKRNAENRKLKKKADDREYELFLKLKEKYKDV